MSLEVKPIDPTKYYVVNKGLTHAIMCGMFAAALLDVPEYRTTGYFLVFFMVYFFIKAE